MSFIRGEVPEQVQKLFPRDGIQTAGGLIENQEAAVVGQGRGPFGKRAARQGEHGGQGGQLVIQPGAGSQVLVGLGHGGAAGGGQRGRMALAALLFLIKHSPVWAMPLLTAHIIDLVSSGGPAALPTLGNSIETTIESTIAWWKNWAQRSNC